MTIDERLEALTQTVELIAHAQVNQLARIAESHEHRLERLGGPQ
jgi:hypothetical protein